VVAGVKGCSGGRRFGSGAQKKADLALLHTMIDSHVGSADWALIDAALDKKTKLGDVQAFRELRACRFGQLPEASQLIGVTEGPEEGHLLELANFVDTGMPGTQPETTKKLPDPPVYCDQAFD
jgi:hypothetical protein